jgi:hypothetical protein
MKIEIDVEMPEGFEATGEYRPARVGEYCLWFDKCSEAVLCKHNLFPNVVILRPKKRKVIKFVECPYTEASRHDTGVYAIGIDNDSGPEELPEWWEPKHENITWFRRVETTE